MVYKVGRYDTSPVSGAAAFKGEPQTLRTWWIKNHGGAYKSYFEEGFAQGEIDLAGDSFAYLTTLELVEVADRDLIWHARLDGYKQATASRGPTSHG